MQWFGQNTPTDLNSIYKCDVNIYFNQQCLKKQLTPTYAHIKVPNTSPAYKYTQHKIPRLRIKDEIKYLQAKKQLNPKIYHVHIYLSNMWNNTWLYIQHTVEEKLNKEAQTKFKTLDKKK
jgi:hypothetical protein